MKLLNYLRRLWRERKCRKPGHSWKCLHCYEPKVLAEVPGIEVMLGLEGAVKPTCLRIQEQTCKVKCDRCAKVDMKTSVRPQIVEANS